ncbi:acyl-CoA dehydrogenase family protein [Sandaracinobacter sp. RS1-74]|uniref:acyl-CoA dehydrogenase family protein n=1 Tax=Sandaracinobacteroides sayramensis TaxID=2913411 RepID=UPI001EDBFFE9|nr:acyl-CoA dehydrogenase family protein [Sandaracinobacteroides sayramensis]
MTERLGLVDMDGFREDVRAFLSTSLTAEMREAADRQAGIYADPDLARDWHLTLYQKGWITPSWPVAYGGTGWTAAQRLTFEVECAAANAPVLPAMGLQMCGPVLIGHGTDEQKARFLPRIRSAEDYWCQGYSEPGAGSDLASLRCRAVRDGDDYVVNGTKIWTTHAQFANWVFLLVRTSSEGPQQAGITFLLAPMDSPGLTVTPIISMSGEHEVNQLFFDNVRVPVALRVGAENNGWEVAKYLLQFERGGAAAGGRPLRLLRSISALMQDAAGEPEHVVHSPQFRRRLTLLEIELSATMWTQRRALSAVASGDPMGVTASSILKLKATEMTQMASELALEALGPFASVDQSVAAVGPVAGRSVAARYLNMRAVSIFGGSSEVQRTILGKELLRR